VRQTTEWLPVSRRVGDRQPLSASDPPERTA